MQNFEGLYAGTFLMWLKCNLDFPCTLTRFFLYLIFLTFCIAVIFFRILYFFLFFTCINNILFAFELFIHTNIQINMYLYFACTFFTHLISYNSIASGVLGFRDCTLNLLRSQYGQSVYTHTHTDVYIQMCVCVCINRPAHAFT